MSESFDTTTREDVLDALRWVLLNGGDLHLHCVSGEAESLTYVGRRFDHSWRRADLLYAVWLDSESNVLLPQNLLSKADLADALKRASKLPGRNAELATLLAAALDTVADVHRTLSSEPVEPEAACRAAVLMYVAQLAVSQFRLSKHQWLVKQQRSGSWSEMDPYRWLQA